MSEGTRYVFVDRTPGDWATHPDRPCADTALGSDRERARIWFSDVTSEQALARRLCDSCPVKEPCLEYALVNNEDYGTWGGISERGRRKLRAARVCPFPSCRSYEYASDTTLRRHLTKAHDVNLAERLAEALEEYWAVMEARWEAERAAKAEASA